MNYLVSKATYHSKKLEAIIEGRPQVLIHNGRIFEEVMKKAQLTHHELNAALRDAGCACAAEAHMAILENTGAISVVPRTNRDLSPKDPAGKESNCGPTPV